MSVLGSEECVKGVPALDGNIPGLLSHSDAFVLDAPGVQIKSGKGWAARLADEKISGLGKVAANVPKGSWDEIFSWCGELFEALVGAVRAEAKDDDVRRAKWLLTADASE